MAHFTHCTSFEHNYLILHPILVFKVLVRILCDKIARGLYNYNSDKIEILLVLKAFNLKFIAKIHVPLRKVFANPVIYIDRPIFLLA